jgi:hypothetical protein
MVDAGGFCRKSAVQYAGNCGWLQLLGSAIFPTGSRFLFRGMACTGLGRDIRETAAL